MALIPGSLTSGCLGGGRGIGVGGGVPCSLFSVASSEVGSEESLPLWRATQLPQPASCWCGFVSLRGAGGVKQLQAFISPGLWFLRQHNSHKKLAASCLLASNQF